MPTKPTTNFPRSTANDWSALTGVNVPEPRFDRLVSAIFVSAPIATKRTPRALPKRPKPLTLCCTLEGKRRRITIPNWVVLRVQRWMSHTPHYTFNALGITRFLLKRTQFTPELAGLVTRRLMAHYKARGWVSKTGGGWRWVLQSIAKNDQNQILSIQ